MFEQQGWVKRLAGGLLALLCLSCAGITGAATSVCPDYDLNDDCVIDFKDVALIGLQWLSERIDCNDGYEDCDGMYETGCETDTWYDANNCGGCGIVCALAHATAECADANCVPAGCEAGYDDCDALPENGCEVDLMNDIGNCGWCGNDCNYPNATAVCQGGNCIMTGCQPGYADCDGQTGNGCEVNLSGGGSCTGAAYIGSVYGDEGCTSGPSRTGRGEQWFQILVRDGSGDPFNTKLYLRVVLQPPIGVDYNLYLYDSCGSPPIASSTGSGSAVDEVNYEWSDNPGDDSRDFWMEVRHCEGSSCSNWSLQTWGDCPP